MEIPNSNMLIQRLPFGFAFNDTNFSDRVLRIEIIPNSSDSNRKRKREYLEIEKECHVVDKVKTLHVNSAILVGQSPYFYKLFKNGMKESQERDVTMRIYEYEEDALMEVVNFMYDNTLKSVVDLDVLNVLIVADKFEVTSCAEYCVDQLSYIIPMSQDSALLYLELGSSVLVGQVMQPLVDAAKYYFAARYNDIFVLRKDVMALPLLAIEAVLNSDDLRVDSEDDVYNFIVEWARAHYPILEERREILTKRLARLIRFPYMSNLKLKDILFSGEFKPQLEVSVYVIKALFLKSEAQNRSLTNLASSRSFLVARKYKLRPVKVVQLDELSRPRAIVYFNLDKEECDDLLRLRQPIESELFFVGGRSFRLRASCFGDRKSSLGHFSLCLYMVNSSTTFKSDTEFAVMRRPSEEFQSVYKVKDYTPEGLRGGLESAIAWKNDLFGIRWCNFIADKSKYFIDGKLHLRAQLTINTP